jgi:hypothetical protein
MNDNPIAALEQAHAALQKRTASAGELKAAAEGAHAAVRALDTENELAPQREAQILAGMASPGGPSMDYVLTALAAIDDEMSRRMLECKIATHLAAALDVRVRERAKFEAERDEARRPFAAQTRRATELAEKILAIYLPNAAKVITLFYDDVLVSRLGEVAYSHLPAPEGTHINYVRTWHVQRLLTTPEVMSATKLPEHWPPRYSDYSVLEQRQHFEEDDDEIICPLRALVKRGPTSETEVDAAIARAQSAMLAQYRQAVDAIEDLLRLDATITVADRELKYQDHCLVFDPALFPSYWLLGRMKHRVVLPSLTGPARVAAE